MANFVKTPEDTPAGYQGPENGPFKCGHCEYFDAGECSKPQVIEELGGKDTAKVEAGGCCNFYESVGSSVKRRAR